jgi:hypothetical protein
LLLLCPLNLKTEVEDIAREDKVIKMQFF